MKQEDLSEILVTLGGAKQSPWKGSFVECLLLMMTYQPPQFCYQNLPFSEDIWHRFDLIIIRNGM